METFAEDDSTTEDEHSFAQAGPDHARRGRQANDARSGRLGTGAGRCGQTRSANPTELLADSHYGSNECLTKGRERGVEIISPAMTAKGKLQGKLTLEDFELDGEGRVLRCPAGKEPLETSIADVRIQVLFDPVGCEGCPHRDNCPAAAVGRSERRWQYNHDRVKQRERRLKDVPRRISRALPLASRNRSDDVSLQVSDGHGTAASSRHGEGDLHGDARALGLNIHRVAVYRAAIR